MLVAYAFGLDFVYRPVVGGPATNPLTALCVMLLGVALCIQALNRSFLIQRVFVVLVLFISLIRVFDGFAEASVHEVFMPFQGVVHFEIAQGMSNDMGFNTGVMLMVLTLSSVFAVFNYQMTSQFFGLFGLFFPMLSFVGFVYDAPILFGEMSFITAVIGVALAISVMTLTSAEGFLWSFMSRRTGGQQLRLQAAGVLMILFALGYVLVKTIESIQIQSFIGLGIVLSSWAAFMALSLLSIYREKSRSSSY